SFGFKAGARGARGVLDSVVGIRGPIYSQIRTSQIRTSQRRFSRWHLALWAGWRRLQEGGHRAPPPLTISTRVPVPIGYPRLAYHRPIQSVYWHCPTAPHECIGAATRKRCARLAETIAIWNAVPISNYCRLDE